MIGWVCRSVSVSLGLAWSFDTIDAKFICGAGSIALFQDVRDGVLLIRFQACNASLETRSGVLGYEALRERSGAQALKDVLSEAMQAFATSFDGVDDRVITSLKQNTHLFVADGASDEQLCGRLLKASIFPNLLLIRKDRTHACTRLLERPWLAIPELRQIVEIFALGSSSTSVINRIFHSPVISAVFEGFCTTAAKNLSIAKQRFSSVSGPLRRCCTHLDAILMTVSWLLINRKGEEQALAVDFASRMDERTLLLTAIMADLSDEGIRLVRFFDGGDYDLCDVCFQLRLFMSRLHRLINDVLCQQ